MLGLSDDWRVWVTENLLEGVEPSALVATLGAEGVPAALARREVEAIASSPALVACRRFARRAAQLESLASLRRTLAAMAPRPHEVERRQRVPADEFFARYYAGNEPVVLTDATDSWPARRLWSPAYFKSRFGEAEVQIVAGRDADPHCDRNFLALRRTVTMAEYVEMVLAAGATNDIYMIANGRNIEREALRGLLDDVTPDPALFDPAPAKGAASLWFGPGGTRTPLHHDRTNVFFCQIFGRKRVDLVSPFETALLRDLDGVYAPFRCEELGRPERPELAGVEVRSVVLEPGEALFIPVGWWHEVRALETSINFSLLNFRRPNDFPAYRPGA